MESNPRTMIYSALLEKAKNLELMASRNDPEENKRLRMESQEYLKLAKEYEP